MHLTGLDLVFWFVTFAEHIALLVILLRVRRLPIFTSLVALNVARTIVLFLLRSHGLKAAYFYTYWSVAVADDLLQLGVVYELVVSVFRPTNIWVPRRKARIIGLVSLSVTVAALVSWIPRPDSEFWLQVVILKLSFFSAALMSELFIGMLALSVRAELKWSDLSSKIAKGFAVYSLITLVLETASSYFGVREGGPLYDVFARIRIVVYTGCAAYWIASLLPSALPGRRIPTHVRRQASAVSEAMTSRLDTLRTEDSCE